MNTNDPPATLLHTHTRMLHSKIVDDEYELSIYLPPSYESSEQAYPTLYVLDSPFVFGSAVVATAGQNLDAGVPEMIVVGIGKRIKNFDEWGACRWRDYTPVPYPDIPGTGYAAAFLNFLEQECIPFIDTHYRTQPNDRIIWGNSMGGLFALYVLFNKTYLFSRYIAIAPAFVMGDTMFLDYEQALAVESLPCEVRLFVSVGSLDDYFAPNAVAFMEALAARKLPNLKFQTSVMEGLGHNTVCVPAFYYGIEAVYKL